MTDAINLLSSSDTARSWAQTAKDLAIELAGTMHTRDEVIAMFDALRSILSLCIAEVARDWNDRHDRSRVLPPEVREMCFAPLSMSTKSRLSRVCTHWRNETVGLPALWTDLNLVLWDPGMDLAAILARSAPLPLSLKVRLDTGQSYLHLDACMRSVAPRLRSLSLVLKSAPPRQLDNAILHYAVPLLEELSLTCRVSGNLAFFTDGMLFRDHAPSLRNVRLDSIPLPAECSAFADVTSCSISYCPGGRAKLFSVLPSLLSLDLSCTGDEVPAVPANAPLRAANLGPTGLTLADLTSLGYTKLPELTVTNYHSARLIVDALVQLDYETASVELIRAHECDVVLELHSDQRTVHITAQNLSLGGVHSIVGDEELCCKLQRLVLPRHLPLDVCARVSRSFARLRTLGIRCGGPAFLTLSSYNKLLRDTPICVPLLARIELLAGTRAVRGGILVQVSEIVTFIQDMLHIEGRTNLVLFVDTADGVRLEGDIDSLRDAGVGTILV